MVRSQDFIKMVSSLNEVEQKDHFDRIAFKVRGKKIFASLLESSNTVNILLSSSDQKAYCALVPSAIFQVPNKWGLQGWTTFEINNLDAELINDAVVCSYNFIRNNKK